MKSAKFYERVSDHFHMCPRLVLRVLLSPDYFFWYQMLTFLHTLSGATAIDHLDGDDWLYGELWCVLPVACEKLEGQLGVLLMTRLTDWEKRENVPRCLSSIM